MKTIAAPAMVAIEAGEAIVTGAVEIIPSTQYTSIIPYNAAFDYFIVPSIVDGDPPESVVVPSSGFDTTANAPFGNNGGTLAPVYPIATAWPGNQSLWLKKVIELDSDGVLTLSGYIENGVLFFLDDAYVGANNYQNVQQGGAQGTAYSIDVPVTTGVHTLKVLCLDEPSGSPDNTYFFVEGSLAFGGSGTPIRVWGGHGPIDIDGSTYQGVGDRGLAQQSAGAVGGFAQGLTLTLSGIEPHLLALLDADEVKGASVVIRRLIFASDGKTLLDAEVFDRGRVDTVETIETIGGGAAIRIAVETAARGLGSSGARQRSDADQRLINASDGYFKNTAFAGEKDLYWGGRKPHRSSS